MDEHDARAETDRAFEGLYRRHRVDVYRAAMRRTHDHHEAEDVTQAAFLDAYRAVLRGTRPELPRPWLLAIAENVRRRRFAATIRRPVATALDEDATASRPSSREDTEDVLLALAALPENQRSAFVLREVAGLSYAEIAEQLGVSLPSVQMLLFRARKSLRTLLTEPDETGSRFYAPAWLSWVATRWEATSVGARAVGAASAAAVVVASVGSASPEPVQRLESASPARPAAVVRHAAATAQVASSLAADVVEPKSTPKRSQRARTAARTTAAAVVRPAAAPVPHLGAGPVAPSAPPAAAAAKSDGPSAPALVPTSPTLSRVVKPVPVPITVAVPVPVPPSVEGVEVPALEVPTVPVLPVEVGSAPPVLPGS